MFKILVTGVSGLQRQRLFEQDLRDVQVHYDLGELMLRIAGQRNLPYDNANILTAPTSTLKALRFSAIERIMNAAQTGDQSRPLIVSAHTVYMLKDRLMEGLSRKDIEAINPDMVVTLVDSPQNIHRQLRNQAGEYFRLPMELIVRWQEFEVFYSNHLAKDYGKPHYVVPVSQADSFRSLLQHNNRRVIYLTYPATNLSEADRTRVSEFINQLKQRCVVFDPAAIATSMARNPNYDLTDYSAINSYTRVRDLEWLIGINADAVVAYLPKVVFSSSMNDELRFAYENGRP
ncbi:MAG: AAA family ATPase, partial [Mycobacterium leprae]